MSKVNKGLLLIMALCPYFTHLEASHTSLPDLILRGLGGGKGAKVRLSLELKGIGINSQSCIT